MANIGPNRSESKGQWPLWSGGHPAGQQSMLELRQLSNLNSSSSINSFSACETLEVPSARIVQGRSFLQFPLNLDSKDDDTPHIDLDEGDRHIVVLYYVVTSDGDTVIYNERTESDVYTVKQKVTPKQGRVVIFDGGQYHTAQQAINTVRCIANYNLA